MAKYICGRCKKIFNKKSNYNCHINRKYKCEIIVSDNNKCYYCEKIFTRKDSLARHIKKNCKYLKFDCECNKNKQKKKIKKKYKTPINIENYNVSNNIININIVKLVKFGEEDLTKIPNEYYIYIFKKGFNSVPIFIKFLHFNKNIPEHHNVYTSNIKSKYSLIYGDDEWVSTNKKKVIKNLYEDISDHLIEKYNEIGVEIIGFINFIKYREDKTVSNTNKEKIKLMMYNNRKMIEDTRNLIESTNILIKN